MQHGRCCSLIVFYIFCCLRCRRKFSFCIFQNSRHEGILADERAKLLEAANAEVAAVKGAAAKEVEARVTSYLQQVEDREGDLMLVREQYAAVQALYKARVDDLKLKVARAIRNARTSEGRRRMDLEGCTRDITSLRRQLGQLERRTGTWVKKATGRVVEK